MSTLEEIRAARARDQASPLAQIRAARASDQGSKSAVLSAVDANVQSAAANLLQPQPLSQDALDRMTLDAVGPVRGAMVKAAQGVPFIGEYYDEIQEARNPGAGQSVRDVQGAMDRQRPNTALASEIAGGVAGSIPFAVGGVGAVGQVPGIAQRVAAGGVAGGLFGAADGTASGYGAGTNRKERREMAAQRGTIGAGVGGVLGALAPVVGSAAKAVYRRVRKLDVATIADEFGVDRRTAGVLKGYLANDDLDAAAATIARIGDDAMLADAGPATTQALDTAAQTGGRALRIASDRVNERAAQAGQRLAKRLDDILGPADGVKAAARDISRRTSSARQQAYNTAFSKPIDYAAPSGRKVEEVLSRIPPRTLRAAVDEANEAMTAAGVRNRQIMAEIAEDGSVVFREMPNVQQLNEIKIALGAQGREAVDQFGRPTAQGLRANKLAGELRDAISEAVPEYRAAVRLGGDKIAEDNALDMGRKLLSRSTTLEDVRAAMKGASVEARAAAKRGLRENIEATLSNVRRTITDPNVDAREAMTLIKDLSSRANMAKARLVLGKDAAALFDELDKAEAALALRAAMSRNSATAIRTAGRESLDAATQPGAAGTLAQGRPVEAAQRVVQVLTGATGEAQGAARDEVAAQIADALTAKRGPEAARALAIVKRAMAGQPVKEAEARLVVRALGDPLLLGGYQSGTQILEQQ